MRMVPSLFAVGSLVLLGCGGVRPSQVTTAQGVTSAAAAKPTAASAPLPPPPSAQPALPRAEPGAPATAPEKAEPDSSATREISYVVVPEGLKINVAGVKFNVSASATQVAAGWGVKLNVVASAVDGKPHSLSSPKAGPLAFAGTVQRKGKSEGEPFGDERVGSGEQGIFGDDPSKFSRTWPARGTRVLGIGDGLDLQVGLWGLGVEKDEQRPVKKFCHVRMQVEKGKPRAILEPPISASDR
jgi:hypothetical protein